MKHIIISVTNDLVTDQRVNKVATSLLNAGFEVTLVGRKLKNSQSISRPYKTKRIKLIFNKGALFYAEYNVRLFFWLLFRKADILLSNDLDTLLANYCVSKIKRKTIVYDSHEYFTEVPELQGRRLPKKVWETIEEWIFPKLKHIYTVNQSIASMYKEKYKVDLKVIRNVSKRVNFHSNANKDELGLPIDKKIILLQGAGINIDRGAEEAVLAMQYIDKAIFLIVGSGDVIGVLKEMVKEKKLEEKVCFIGKVPYEQLVKYTKLADIGLSLDKDTNINYRFSLPNKIFDYIHAGTPVLASNLIEVATVIKNYNVGTIVETHDPKAIAEKINFMLNNQELMNEWKENTKIASNELCWEEEEKKLLEIYKPLL